MDSKFWEKNSEQWRTLVDSGGISSRMVTGPALISALENKKLKSILDVGCGEGWLSRTLPSTTEYCGIDGSAPLVEIARKNSPGVFFEKASYDDLIQGLWTSKRLFDASVFNFSLLDKNCGEILATVQKFLNPGGLTIIQTLHPCFKLSDYTDGWREEDFKSAPMPFTETMPWFGRTLASWIKLFNSCGLYLDDLLEPSSSFQNTPTSIIYLLKPRVN